MAPLLHCRRTLPKDTAEILIDSYHSFPLIIFSILVLMLLMIGIMIYKLFFPNAICHGRYLKMYLYAVEKTFFSEFVVKLRVILLLSSQVKLINGYQFHSPNFVTRTHHLIVTF